MTRASLRTVARAFAQSGSEETLQALLDAVLAFPVDQWPNERIDMASQLIERGVIHAPIVTGGAE